MSACEFLKQSHPYFKITPSPPLVLPQASALADSVHISLATILEAVASSQCKRQDVFSTVRSCSAIPDILQAASACQGVLAPVQEASLYYPAHYITNEQ